MFVSLLQLLRTCYSVLPAIFINLLRQRSAIITAQFHTRAQKSATHCEGIQTSRAHSVSPPWLEKQRVQRRKVAQGKTRPQWSSISSRCGWGRRVCIGILSYPNPTTAHFPRPEVHPSPLPLRSLFPLPLFLELLSCSMGCHVTTNLMCVVCSPALFFIRVNKPLTHSVCEQESNSSTLCAL